MEPYRAALVKLQEAAVLVYVPSNRLKSTENVPAIFPELNPLAEQSKTRVAAV